MSERNGDCPRCRGQGAVLIKTGVVDPSTKIEEAVSEECGRCDGTGFDGSAYPEIGFIDKPRQRTPEELAEYEKRRRAGLDAAVAVFLRGAK